MNLLIIGGSGKLSGRLAEIAVEKGHQVWAVTRGTKPLPEGVKGLVADREDAEAFHAALESAGVKWDAAFDCIGMKPEHARQNLTTLPAYTKRLVVVSTDSVYHPAHKAVPQNEEPECYIETGYGHNKRLMEEVYLSEGGDMDWTIFRPGHIYGPRFQIGCLPEHSRQADLVEHIRAGRPLRLVGGWRFLLQPVYVDDLVLAMLDCLDNPKTLHEIFCIGGPETVPNAQYYVYMGQIVGNPAVIEDIDPDTYPDKAKYPGFLCQRAYDQTKLIRAGIRVPDMPLKEGLRRQIEWLDAQKSGE